MSDRLFARVCITLVNVILVFVCVGVYFAREYAPVTPEETYEPAAHAPDNDGRRYYSPCITCATTVFDREGNVIATLPPVE